MLALSKLILSILATNLWAQAIPDPVKVQGSDVTITGSRYGLPPPHPITPSKNALILKGEKIFFLWSPIRDADGYRFRLVNAGAPERNIYIKDLDENSLELRDVPPSSYRELPTGEYLWFVSALTGPDDVARIAGNESVGRFTITTEPILYKRRFLLGIKLAMGAYSFSGNGGGQDQTATRSAGATRTVLFTGAFSPAAGHEVSIRGGFTRLVSVIEAPPDRGPYLRELTVNWYGLYARSPHLVEAERQGKPAPVPLRFGVGLSGREILHLEYASHPRKPGLFGATYGFQWQPLISSSWSLNAAFEGFFPFMVTHENDASLRGFNGLHGTFEGGVDHWVASDFSVGLALEGGHYRHRYSQQFADATARMWRWGATLRLGLSI
jgi:hypothetical protein